MSPSYSGLNLVLIGPPGSGKGTQARLLAERYCIAHIDAGELLREESERATPLGVAIKGHVDAGTLVPDELLRGIILQRLHRVSRARGFVLDGFPRTAGQARVLDDLLAELGRVLERALLLKVPDKVIIQRLGDRWIHPASGREYNKLTCPPRTAGIDDSSGDELIQRADDREDVVRERLSAFHEKIAQVANYYHQRGLLVEVDASLSRDQVSEAVMQAVGAPVGA